MLQSLKETVDLLGENIPFFDVDKLGLEDSLLENIFLLEYSYSLPNSEGVFRTVTTLSVYVNGGVNIALPTIDFFNIFLSDEYQSEFISFDVFIETKRTDDPSFFAALGIKNLPIALEFKNNLIRSVKKSENSGEYEPVDAPFRIESNVTFRFNTEYQAAFNFEEGISIPAFAIGSTGLICEIENFDFTISKEAPSLRVERLLLVLPSDIKLLDTPLPELVFDDVSVGKMGFSGIVNATWPLKYDDGKDNPFYYDIKDQPEAKLFGFQGGIRSIQVIVFENKITGSALNGQILLPYFNQPVDITISLLSTENGGLDFLIELNSEDGNEITLSKEELLALHIKKLCIEKRSPKEALAIVSKPEYTQGTFGISGGMELLLWKSDGLEWPRLDIRDLTLTQNLDDFKQFPQIQFKEAWLDLKKIATLDLFGFHFELNRVGMGYKEKADKLWIDLTGSLKLIEQIPIGLSVEGFRITWPSKLHEDLLELFDSDNLQSILSNPEALLELGARIEVRFDGVHLIYGIPQAVEFEGFIRFIKEAQVVGFTGNMALRLPATGLALEAGLMVGMNFEAPAYPFLYLYFGIQLPSGIPIAQSGLALKGAKGMFGLNVTPDKTPEQNPYYDWYKRGPIEGVHPINKWKHHRWSVALGAGVTITTADGKILGVQGLLALVIPGPIVFIEGKTLIFRDLLPIDGPFKGLGYLDGDAGTLQLNIEAGAEIVDDVIDVNANVEAFFDFTDPTKWHVYLGQDSPTERRVRAEILKLPGIGWLFSGSSYLMVNMGEGDSISAKFGAEISFKPPPLDLNIATVKMTAQIDAAGFLSINPFIYTGELGLEANLRIRAFDLFNVTAIAEATAGSSGPLPLVVDADINIKVELPVPDLSDLPIAGEFVDDAIAWFEEAIDTDLSEIYPEHLEFKAPFHWEYNGVPEIEPLVRSASLDRALALSERSVEMLTIDSSSAVTRSMAESAPIVELDAKPVINFSQSMNQKGNILAADFTKRDIPRHFNAGHFKFKPTLNEIVLSRSPKTGNGALSWEEVGKASIAPPDESSLWSTWRSGQQLACWTINPFEILIDQPTIELAGVTDVRRLERMSNSQLEQKNVDIVEHCIGEQELKTANIKRAIDVESKRNFQYCNIDDVLFSSHHLRLKDNPVFLQSKVGDKKSPTLNIEFPDKIVKAFLIFFETSAMIKYFSNNGSEEIISVDSNNEIILFFSKSEYFNNIKIISNDPLKPVNLKSLCWVTVENSLNRDYSKRRSGINSEVLNSIKPSHLLTTDYFYKFDVITTTKLESHNLTGVLGAFDEELNDFINTYEYSGEQPKKRKTGDEGNKVTQSFLFQTDGPPRDLERYLKWSSIDDVDYVYPKDDILLCFRRHYISKLYSSPFELEALCINSNGEITNTWKPEWRKTGSSTVLPIEHKWRNEINRDLGISPALEPDDMLVLSNPDTPLPFSESCTLVLSGGEGGKLLIDDKFDGEGLDYRWVAENQPWDISSVSANIGNTLWWHENIEDVQVITRIRILNGDKICIFLRHPRQKIEGNCHSEITLERDGFGKLKVQLRVCLIRMDNNSITTTTIKQTVQKETIENEGDVLTVRVQQLGSRIKCQINQLVVFNNVILTTQAVAPTAFNTTDIVKIGLASSGSLGFNIVKGDPKLLRVRIADPTLLQKKFKTSSFGSLAELVESNTPQTQRVSTQQWGTDVLDAGHDATEKLKTARIAHRKAAIDFRDMSINREQFEQSALLLRTAEAVLDEKIYKIFGVDFMTKRKPSVLTTSSLYYMNEIVAILLDSPEPFDLEIFGGRLSIGLYNEPHSSVMYLQDRLTKSLSSSDESRILLYFDVNGTPSNLSAGSCELTFRYTGDFGDDQESDSNVDHRYDRTIHSANNSRAYQNSTASFLIA